MMTKYQTATSAEAIAAAQFARLGCNVAVQYGANQPQYDLMISDEQQRTLLVSVKGNSTGSWLLAARMHGDYHATIDLWLAKQGPRTVYCFVQFRDVAFDQMPRVYVARPADIATRLKAARGGKGHGGLTEDRHWKTARAAGAGTVDRVPDDWRLSAARLEALW
jgi:hypothetical protein